MYYLAIDQHARQLTVNLRNEEGTVTLRRQVSTQPAKVREFFAGLREQTESDGGYMTILEVCGFNPWLMALLTEYGCRETVLVQCDDRKKQKTDRRDADRLGEVLWVNRARLRGGQRVQGLRRIQPASPADAEARQLTGLRQSLGRERTRVLNRIAALLKKHNLQHDCPTKGLQTKGAKQWLATVLVGGIDRLELDQLLVRWELFDTQIAAVVAKIMMLRETHRTAALISSVPGLNGYGGLAIAARIGDVNRFARPASLANFFGLAPKCRNSGDSGQRLGGITKQGSALARFLLGQAVLHVLRRDPALRAWYKKVRSRRGSKIARVAVMRRLAVAIWHMLKHEEPYRPGGSPARREAGQRRKPKRDAGPPSGEA